MSTKLITAGTRYTEVYVSPDGDIKIVFENRKSLEELKTTLEFILKEVIKEGDQGEPFLILTKEKPKES